MPHVAFKVPADGGRHEGIAALHDEVRRLRATSFVNPRRVRGGSQSPKVDLSPDLRRRAEDVFHRVQSSLDGAITKQRLQDVLRQDGVGADVLFAELDGDHSGKVTMQQWLSWLMQVEAAGLSAASVLDWIEERSGVQEEAHVRFDEPDAAMKNLRRDIGRLRATSVVDWWRVRGDGAAVELSEALHRRAVAAFRAIDKVSGGTGRITKQEIREALHEDTLGAEVLFAELDTNHTGDVTLEEWICWLKKVEGSGQSAANMVHWIEERLGEHEAHHVHFADELSRMRDDVSKLRACSVVDVRRRLRQHESGGNLPEELRPRAEAAFRKIDALHSNNGRITKEDLHSCLAGEGHLGAEVLFRELDAGETGEVSLDEWLAWLARVQHTGHSAASMLDWIEEMAARAGSQPAQPLGRALPQALELLHSGALTPGEFACVVAELLQSCSAAGRAGGGRGLQSEG
eukprot:TRINITY_DN2962_c0_g1_i1.p1 TRINITY_DN2962_c0_g1~~TRINITY_DN2962_c0_g1_i1.p1  ORF type:complete len:459 (+),score=110.03 TRINITY_DN2962_c0_g1_i1:85-1461(+)